MQLVDGHLHGCFCEHLRAHVEHQTPLDDTSRHVCDRLVFLKGISGFVLGNDALTRCCCWLSCGAVSMFRVSPVFYKRLSVTISATSSYFNGLPPDVI